jgi:hypothetical protein
MININVVDFAIISFAKQLEIVRNSNIIVGVHGAGLTWIMFAAEEAVLVEMHPSYRLDRHFRHLARLVNKDYLPMRSLSRETCLSTSDTVHIAIPEFLRTMDGAVRLARSYDNGISECGLHCAEEMLALDSTLDHLFPNSTSGTRTPPLDTKFPCL